MTPWAASWYSGVRSYVQYCVHRLGIHSASLFKNHHAARRPDPRNLLHGEPDSRTLTSDRYRPHDPLPSHTARNQYVQLSTPMPALMTHIDPQHPAHKHLAPLPCLTTCTCLYSHSPYEVDSSLRHLTTSPQPQQSTSYQPTPMPHSSYTPLTQIYIPSYPTHTLTIAHSLTHPPRRTPTPLRPPQ